MFFDKRRVLADQKSDLGSPEGLGTDDLGGGNGFQPRTQDYYRAKHKFPILALSRRETDQDPGELQPI